MSVIDDFKKKKIETTIINEYMSIYQKVYTFS